MSKRNRFMFSVSQKPGFNNDQIFAGEYFVLVLVLAFVQPRSQGLSSSRQKLLVLLAGREEERPWERGWIRRPTFYRPPRLLAFRILIISQT